ncbi:oxidoreductase [Aureococcus anophagefferens]|nr:oxidoreductase [Aureococcus anophagefferens]
MRGVVARDGKCVVVDVEEPVCTPDDLIIEVKATAVNRLDTLQRKGKAKPPPGASEVLGLEVAGVVAAVGRNAEAFAVGDEVCALVSGGAFAERVAVDARAVLRKPKNLSFREAAAVPETWLTAFQLLFLVGALAPGESVLLHAAASGVGCAATQLAAKHGGRVWLEGAVAANGGKGFDVILDCVASTYASQNVEALAVDGRWVLYSVLTGPKLDDAVAATFLGKLLAKRASLLATTLRARPIAYKAKLVAAFDAATNFQAGFGGYEVVVDRVFTGLDSAQDAHDAWSPTRTSARSSWI